jgi:CRISPR-associated endonuclease/helicase Cas3
LRQVVAVCRSRKKALAAAARVLDRYFWRVGDRTWRGRASTACLERVAADLRRAASKNLAVAVHEVGRRAASRRPLFVVGARGAFGPDGVVPVATAGTRGDGAARKGAPAHPS